MDLYENLDFIIGIDVSYTHIYTLYIASARGKWHKISILQDNNFKFSTFLDIILMILRI